MTEIEMKQGETRLLSFGLEGYQIASGDTCKFVVRPLPKKEGSYSRKLGAKVITADAVADLSRNVFQMPLTTAMTNTLPEGDYVWEVTFRYGTSQLRRSPDGIIHLKEARENGD